MVKNLPAMWEVWVQSLGWQDPLEKGMATHSVNLAWKIPWTEESGRLQSMGLKEPDATERLTLSLFIRKSSPPKSYNFWKQCTFQSNWCRLGWFSWWDMSGWDTFHIQTDTIVNWMDKKESVSPVWLLVITWMIGLLAPLFMEFSRQECGSG